ncbi:MAG: hypothetical protein JST16_15760 [Bdellovibrionales bacterium]|nr:hypothetical protein [Bdellovibrionales bacterium]
MIFKMSLKHLLSKPVSSFMTLMAVASSLTILGSFWTVVENLERVRFQQRGSVTSSSDPIPGLTIFVDSRLGEAEIQSLRTKILEDKRFQSADIVSSGEALKALEQQFGETLSKVFGEESLPVTLKLRFSDSTMTRQDLVNLLNSLRSMSGVLDVDDGMALAPVTSSSVSSRLFSWATGLLVIVFIVVALLVSHLIRLAFESLRGEIETMKVIGASNRWIVLPLLTDGLFLGLGGSLLSLGALMTLVNIVLPKFAHVLLPKGVAISGLSLPSALLLLGLGTGASLLGALITWPLVVRAPQEI